MIERPHVGVVVVSYNAVSTIDECLQSIQMQLGDFDHEVFVVDSGSTDETVAYVQRNWPKVSVLPIGKNVGFAQANNQVFFANHPRKFDFWMLLNPDARFDTNSCIKDLLDSISTDPQVGAVACTVLFEQGLFEVAYRWSPNRPSDGRIGSIKLLSLVQGSKVESLISGTFGENTPDNSGRILLTWRTAKSRTEEIQLEFVAVVDGELRIGDRCWSIQKGEVARICVPADAGRTIDFVNGQGAFQTGLDAGDIGFMSVYDGPSDVDQPVEAWSGCAVMLRATYVDQLSGFDEGFFLYYEDADFSARGQTKGWRYLCSAKAVVRHRHSVSTKALGNHTRDRVVAQSRGYFLARNVPVRVSGLFFAKEVRKVARFVLVSAAKAALFRDRSILGRARPSAELLGSVTRGAIKGSIRRHGVVHSALRRVSSRSGK